MERAFDLALGLGAIRRADSGEVTAEPGECDQCGVANDVAGDRILVVEDSARAVVENLIWHTVECLEGADLAANPSSQRADVAGHQ